MTEREMTILGRPLSPALAGAAVRSGAAWIALGGLAKLFWGTPYDLPEVLHGLMSSDPAAFLALVIGVELFAATLALFSPRLGWWGVAALLSAFTIIAGIETVRGAEACGCFAGAVQVPPWLMLILDLVLLAGVLAVRPWAMLRSAPWRIWSIGPALGGFVIAFLVIGEEAAVPAPNETIPLARNQSLSDPVTPAGNQSSSSSAGGGADVNEIPRVPPGQETQPPPPQESTWRLPESMPRFVVLQPNRWIGQALAATDLATWADVAKFPADATIIFYMDTCPHCRDLLREKAMLLAPPDFVLIRIPAPPNLPIYVKNEIPRAMKVDLPRGTRWNIEVPWVVIVEGGVVQSAEYHGH